MKILNNKKFMRAISILCLILILFSPTHVQASAEDDGFGGKLLGAVFSMFVAIFDSVYDLISNSIMGTSYLSSSLMPIGTESSIWEKFVRTIITIVAVIIVGVITGGASLIALIATGIIAWTASGKVANYRLVTEDGKEFIASGTEYFDESSGLKTSGVIFDNESLPTTLYLPIYGLHLGSIFAGDILAFDVNFFEPRTAEEGTNSEGYTVYYLEKNDVDGYQENEDVLTSKSNSAEKLRNIVSEWYYRLRNIAIIASMLVLLYVGLRILLGSMNPENKAKYKTMIFDWIISICLIFFMHYIMLFSTKIVEYVSDFITANTNEGGAYVVVMETTDKMKEELEGFGDEYFMPGDSFGYDNEVFVYPTNMMGAFRLKAQFATGYKYIAYGAVFIICALYVAYFTYTYLRRVLYMAFLTMIAPLVALTYPIDKITDGKAQAFNNWLREYIFNLLIQPMHLLLYTILITSAFELSSESVIYAIVAIGFMMPAEKLIRSFFGFDKAKTPGLLAGAGGAALVMSGIKGLNKFAKGNNNGLSDNSDGDSKKDYSFKPTRTFNDIASSTSDNMDASESDSSDTPRQSEKKDEEMTEEEKEALRKYNKEGFNKNADGQYYNPYIDEYDDEYSPLTDTSYNPSYKPDNSTDDDTGSDDSTITDTTENTSSSTIPQVTSRGVKDYGNSEYSNRDSKSGKKTKIQAFRSVAGKKLKRKVSSALKNDVRTIAGALGAVSMAGLGAVIGASTGDIRNVQQFGVAAGAVGNAFGQRVTNDAYAVPKKVKDFKQEVIKETNDKEIINEYNEKRFLKDKEARDVYAKKLGLKKRADIDKAMKEAAIYKRAGVTDDKIIASAMKEKGLGSSATDDKRILAAKIAEKTNGSREILNYELSNLRKNKGFSNDTINKLRTAISSIDGEV